MSFFYWTAFNQKVFRGFSIVSASVVRAEDFHDSYHRKDASSQIASGNQHTNRMVLFQPHWLSQTLPEIFDKKLGKWYKLISLCPVCDGMHMISCRTREDSLYKFSNFLVV